MNLEQLISERNYPCISITIPNQNNFFKNRESLKKAILEVEHLLEKFPLSDASKKDIFKKLDGFLCAPDDEWDEGIGIYVSPGTNELITFPFAVSRKVSVDQHFENPDLECLKQLDLSQ
jgi:hypothetical protein